jgi:glycine/D-amino acid oxidase-like deaminating enzyme
MREKVRRRPRRSPHAMRMRRSSRSWSRCAGRWLALESRAVRHVIFSEEVYLVPRADELLVGSTMERVGLAVETTPEALDALRERAVALCPALAGARVTRSWSGLRPVTPDLQPIIGADPSDQRVILACGHSRNGILLAPLTGQWVAEQLLGREPTADLTPFSLGRFS